MNILIATDGSESASNALDFLLRFPFPRDSKTTVLTVVNDIPMLPPELDALNPVEMEALDLANKRLREEAEELVSREAGRLRESGWPCETLVRQGNSVDEILAVAEEAGADLIVLGSHGTGMARRFLLGSVSDRVLEYASCSVLIVRQKSGEAMPASVEAEAAAAWRIMLAYDTSEAADQALGICSSLRLGRHSEITAVYVMPLISAYRQDVRQHINSIWLRKKTVMQAELEKAVNSLRWATPNVNVQLRESDNVSDEILAAVEESGVDLLMIGCKDKGGLKRILLGSITRRVARHADCNVWAVRKKSTNR